ncbi:MAG: Sb-PDE family phosphodiesterase [Flavobacteriaceae bacterium]|nr:Sb-PDE family phosphodiesterase [Flavobacteriaceae bacterium]
MKNYLFLVVFICYVSVLEAQEKPHSHASSRKIEFPDIDGFKTLVSDFHQHTVFSDGNVWPSIRVQEALRDGLDVISMTEHLEYLPHKNDIPHKDRNRAHDIALKEAENHDLIVVRGSEITRSMPPGHSNAIFIDDANKLLIDNPMSVFKEAKNQGAFVFWNHPNWIAQVEDGVAKLTKMHKKLLKNDLLHGIEVVNDKTYSDEALQIALDNDLTIIGASDIHGLIDWAFEIPKGGHRPVTLVFAKEKTESSVKEALFEKRTVVYFNDLLIGRKEYLIPLINASLNVIEAKYIEKSTVLSVTIKNDSDVDYLLKNLSKFTFHNHSDIVTLKSHESTTINIKTIEKLSTLDISFKVLNGILAPKINPDISFKINIDGF